MYIPHTITPANFPTSARTLADWRADRRTPGPVSALLLELMTEGRIMPDLPQWGGWRFVGGFLETVSGDKVAPGELDNVRLLRGLLDQSYLRERRLQATIAAQDAYIKQLEGDRAAANAPRLGGAGQFPRIIDGN